MLHFCHDLFLLWAIRLTFVTVGLLMDFDDYQRIPAKNITMRFNGLSCVMLDATSKHAGIVFSLFPSLFSV